VVVSLQSSLQLAELHPTDTVELSTAASAIPLDDPLGFEQWWFDQVQSFDRKVVADQLELIGTPLAMVRCGQVLGYHPSALERGTRCYAAGLLSENPAVRLFALLRLAHFKTQIGYAALGSDLYGSPTAIPAAEAILETAESLERQSLLLLEVKTRAHALLAEAHWLEGRHETAKRHIAQALLMADALGLWASKQRMELIQYEIYFDSGQVLLALEQCQRLAEDPNTQAVFANRSGHRVALAYIAIGDDDAAIAWCNAHINDGGVYPFLRGYAQAVAGIGGLDYDTPDYARHFTSELTILYQCQQLLLEYHAKLDATIFHKI
jgi:tetratricopeptide (TPR) repeat protein